jgi:hypothetical protein
VADLFDRLGVDGTSDVELAHDLIESLVRGRNREAQMKAALRTVYDLADHAPVATKAERVIADIQHACKSGRRRVGKSCTSLTGAGNAS